MNSMFQCHNPLSLSSGLAGLSTVQHLVTQPTHAESGIHKHVPKQKLPIPHTKTSKKASFGFRLNSNISGEGVSGRGVLARDLDAGRWAWFGDYTANSNIARVEIIRPAGRVYTEAVGGTIVGWGFND